jgi:hypothetical protein
LQKQIGIDPCSELTIILALVFFCLGAALVYEGNVPTGDLTQSARIIGGAVFLALGLIMPGAVLKNRARWKQSSRNYRKV